jgi:hypothetical protein
MDIMSFSLSISAGMGALAALTEIKDSGYYAELFEGFSTNGSLLSARIDDLDGADELFDRIDVALLDAIVALPDPVDAEKINGIGELKRLMIEIQRDVDRHRIYIAREREANAVTFSTDLGSETGLVLGEISHPTSTGAGSTSLSSQHGADDLQVKENDHEEADQLEEQPVERKRGRRGAGSDG